MAIEHLWSLLVVGLLLPASTADSSSNFHSNITSFVHNASKVLMDTRHPPSQPPPSECITHQCGPQENLIRLSAKYGTTPYTILKFNAGKLPSNSPYGLLPEGVTLQICSANDGRFRKEPGCLQRWPRPCSGYQDKEQEDCYCSYHEDNTYKYPFTQFCQTYIQCEGFKSKGLGTCHHHKVVDDLNIMAFYNYLQGSSLLQSDHRRKLQSFLSPDICVYKPEAWNGCNPESCSVSQCFGYEFLLPQATYANPFDQSYQMAFEVDENSLWKYDLMCDNFMTWNKDKGQCEVAKTRSQEGVCLADEQKRSVYNMEQVALQVIAFCPEGAKNLRPATRRLQQRSTTNAANPSVSSSGAGGSKNVEASKRSGCRPPQGGNGVGACRGISSRRRRSLQSVLDFHQDPAFYAFFLEGQPLTGLTKTDLNPQSKHTWLKMMEDGKLGK